MSYSSRELSEDTGKPRELYWFMQGTQSWTYTSAAEPMDFESLTFNPVNGLSRGSIKEGAERTKTQVTVEMPRDTAVAGEFVGVPNATSMWLSIYRIHEGESEFRLTWQGRVRFAEFAGIKVTLTLDTILMSNKKSALRHLFQNQCNHFTFDANCGLSEAAFSHATSVVSIDNNILTVDDAQADGYYIAGQVKRANGDRRFIVTDTLASGVHTLELLTPFEDLNVSEDIIIIGGACRHTFDTCPVEVQPNYGGFPKVPRINPFKSFH